MAFKAVVHLTAGIYRRPYVLVFFLLSMSVLVAHLPTLLWSVSLNPLVSYAGLSTNVQHGPLPGVPTIDPNAGTTTQALGKVSADQWLKGQVPWWNFYSGVGLPLAAEMQSSSLFLPFVLLLHFSSGVILLRIAMQVFAGMATFALLRRLELRLLPAFLGCILYMFNGTFAWFQHAAILPLPFLPLLLLGLESSFLTSAAKKRGGWVIVAVAIAASLYAGFPETAYLNGLLAAAWAVTRVVQLPGVLRLSLLVKNLAGLLVGLLLASPAVLPFLNYLNHSAISHSTFRDAALPSSSLVQLFFPYILGPLGAFVGSDSSNELLINWGNIGGYLGLSTVFLAVLGFTSGRGERALRILLGLWIVCFVGRSIGAPGFIHMFYLLPASDLVAVFRYGMPSCEMAMAILAAFVINDWIGGCITSRVKSSLALGITAGLALSGLVLARPLLGRLLLATSHERPFWEYSIVIAGAFLTVTFLIIGFGHPCSYCRYVLSVLLISESIALFSLPMLSGVRNATFDLGPVNFLRTHLGFYRFYSLGPLHPNYGAFFHLASVNYSMLPVDKNWVTYLHEKLDPQTDSVLFSGDFPAPQADREEALRNNQDAFKQAGVKYIVASPGSLPLSPKSHLSHPEGGNTPIFLRKGQSISGVLTFTTTDETIEAIGTIVSSDQGKAHGTLDVTLCSPSACVTGRLKLPTVTDNINQYLQLDRGLHVHSGDEIRYSFTHKDDSSLAIWVWPTSDHSLSVLTDGRSISSRPDFTLVYKAKQVGSKIVYESSTSRVFELINPAPYFEVISGECKVVTRSREDAELNCQGPGVLLRRELSYPGWRASLNHKSTLKVEQNSIFQCVKVPAGLSHIEFSYEPLEMKWCWPALSLGIIGLLTQLRIRRSDLKATLRARFARS